MQEFNMVKLGGDAIVWGVDSIDYLENVKGKNKSVIIIHDEIFADTFIPRIKNIYEEQGYKISEFYDIEPNPTIKSVDAGAQKMLETNPGVIVAVGGGSVMDAAKAMWVIYENPELESFANVAGPTYPNVRQKAIMVCIPTTSGTASEVTTHAMVTDSDNDIKGGITDYRLIPDIAILDPKLTVTMPKSVTASTGMDALTHALEAKVSRKANVFSDLFADEALAIIIENIRQAYNEPNNLEVREKMHLGSLYAGLAFTNASVGIVHSISHAFGGEFDVAHGLANAIIMPHVLKFNATCNRANEIYREIEEDLGLSGSLIEMVLELNKDMDIPSTLQEIINKDSQYEDAKARMLEYVKVQNSTRQNPVFPNDEEFLELFDLCYYG